ncbi:MAG: hypothetical protein HDR01_00360 [Lachnospiraceae bacterium]|nr:hypothetical protein [Lachnospiraceae bacterium]
MKTTPKIIFLFNTCFFLFFSFLWLEMLFLNNSNNQFHPLKQICFAFLWTVFLALGAVFFYLLKLKYSAFFIKYYTPIVYCILAGLFLLQLFFVCSVSTQIGWDCNNLITPALSDEIGSYNTYFSQYPHNLFLLLILKGLGKCFGFLGIHNMWLAYSVFNTVMVDFAILFLVKSALLIGTKKFSYITLWTAILFLGFTPYLIVPYTDTLSMPFIAGAFYFYCWISLCWKQKKKALFPLLCFPFFLLLGFLIKPTAAILLIAIVLIFLCFHFKQFLSEKVLKKLFLKRLGYFLGCGLFLLAGFKGFHSYADTLDMLDLNHNLSVSMTHYLMMGTNILKTETGFSYGGFNMDDINITMSYTNPKDAKKANLEEYKKRMKRFGIIGYLDFLNKKARQVTSEGDFYWGDEGSFADWSRVGENLLTELIYPNGAYYRIYTYVLQGLWILIFLGVALSPVLQKTDPGKEFFTVVRCAIFGSLLFILIFEGRSRYLINYLPFYVLLAAYGYERVLGNIQNSIFGE